MRADLLLDSARFVLVCDEQATALPDTSVAIADGRIVAMGPATELRDAIEADRVIDARGHLILPGLVNLHTHLPMTLLRGVAENVDLQGFLSLVWAEEARVMDPEGVELGARLGAVEALLGGTTTALDMYFHPEAAHRGAVSAGLRHVIGPVFFSFPGPDGLSWEQRMEIARAWPEVVRRIGGPYVPVAYMPHAPFTVDIENLSQIAELARETEGIITTHTSENESENRDTLESRGMRPTACLDVSGVLSLQPVLAHGVRLDADDRRVISAAGASVAHCPGSNLKLASGAADIVGYRSDGIRVGLGTDGCSSSNDLDMFAVMRLAANLARLVRDDPAAISAADVVRMATLEGARSLGLGDRLGSVEVGKEADLVLIDARVPHLTPLHDPYTAVVFAAGRSDVRHVLVAGQVVVDDRRVMRVDVDAILAAAQARVGS
ncbi:MAG TPA: N-ethylammeline chlorohydrolase [Actinobacteria bacterium]|jgi:5-methylthioadenosine/S-adenosylhomocysteine deaminase|nr:N-ethylammeline chlorohydrolase [Actinomycetota bacterium]